MPPDLSMLGNKIKKRDVRVSRRVLGFLGVNVEGAYALLMNPKHDLLYMVVLPMPQVQPIVIVI
jgi:hypothetical protein